MKWPKRLYSELGEELVVLAIDPNTDEAKCRDNGHRIMDVQRNERKNIYQVIPNDINPLYWQGKLLYKEKKMFREEQKKITKNVKQETVDVSLITVGRIVYTNGYDLVARFTPKLKWYEKLFVSKTKREIAELVGTYIALQVIKTKYNHYLIDAVSAYINFELQSRLMGGVNQEVIDKMFSKLETK